MPVPDTRTLRPFYSVEQNAAWIRNYRYAEERMFRVLAGWIALTPELSVKLLMARHVWDCAQHADILGKRLPELRATPQVSQPANEDFVSFMQAIEEHEGHDSTIERLVGIYRVLKPHLLTVYQGHLAQTNPVFEPPTQRILQRLIGEERAHIEEGRQILDDLTRTVAKRERALEWQIRLERLLVKAGGVTGARD